jgi:hypothetical protein
MLDRLGKPERIAGGGAAAALISTLLPWYHFDEGGSRVTANAFGTGFLGDVLFLCAGAMIVVLLIRAEVILMRRQLDDRRALVGLGVVALAAVVLQLLIGVNGSGAFHSATIGLVVALFASGAMSLGAFMSDHTEVGGHSMAARRR